MWKAEITTEQIAGFSIGCWFQVRVHSDLHLYFGFTPDIHNDKPDNEPSNKQCWFFIVLVTNSENFTGVTDFQFKG